MRNSSFGRRVTQAILTVFLATALAVSAESDQPAPASPEGIVHTVTLAVTQRLAASAAELEADPEAVTRIVVDLVLPHVDFPRLTETVLGAYWAELSNGERRCMTDGLRERLVERYARVLLDYEYTSIVTNPLDVIPGDAPVYVTQTALTPNPQPLSIKYKMELIDGEWKVVDLIVADVSLVKSYRAEYSEEIAELGLGDFLRTIPACRER